MMRPITETISLEDARRLLLDSAPPIERIERMPLASGDGSGPLV